MTKQPLIIEIKNYGVGLQSKYDCHTAKQQIKQCKNVGDLFHKKLKMFTSSDYTLR